MPPKFSLWTLPFNSWIQFLLFIFISRFFNTFSFKSLPMSLGCSDRTNVLVSLKFPEVAGFWQRDIDFNYICFV